MFSYYAKWTPHYSEKIKPLVVLKKFPLNDEALHASTTIKTYLQDLPFILETDASDNAISATLNQQADRPVAFFSRMLNKRELHYSSVKKGALAIIEALRKWAHFLTGRHFTIVTDQQSVSFMNSGENRGKIKNGKVLRWSMELNEFDFEIVYRSGKLNSAPDALSRVYCANMNGTALHEIHASLCQPGITRLHHFVRAKNLPYSVEDVRQKSSRL